MGIDSDPGRPFSDPDPFQQTPVPRLMQACTSKNLWRMERISPIDDLPVCHPRRMAELSIPQIHYNQEKPFCKLNFSGY